MMLKNLMQKWGLASSIYDTEYITKDKNGDNINLLMIFDLYFINGEDVRGSNS